MIRTSMIAAAICCAALGYAMFRVKYEVLSLDQQITQLSRQIVADQDQLHPQAAEWSFLTRQERLLTLSGRFLTLQPLTSAQVGSFETLPLKADETPDPVVAKATNPSKDVPIEDVLRAMQVAARAPESAAPLRKTAMARAEDLR